MSNDNYYHLYRLYDPIYEPSNATVTTGTASETICYIIEDGNIRQVTAKELAIEEIKAQPFF